MSTITCILLLAFALALSPAAIAQNAPPREWSAEKCRRYREASEEALRPISRRTTSLQDRFLLFGFREALFVRHSSGGLAQ